MNRDSIISKKYAKSLFLLGEELSCHEKFLSNLDDFNSYMNYSDLSVVLNSPIINLDIKKEIIKDIFVKFKAYDAFKNFIFLLLDFDRISLIKNIYKIYILFLDEKNNNINFELVLSQNSGSGSLRNIKKSVLSILKSKIKKNIFLDISFDSDLLGGFVLKWNNFELDLSLKNKINSFFNV